jgi:hypothetical protein
LIFWVIFKISETDIKKRLFFVRDRRILGGKRIPYDTNQLQPLGGAENFNALY